MGHHPFGAVIGQRQQAATVAHQGNGPLRDRREAVAGDVQAADEVFVAGVDVLAFELVLVRIGNGVHQEVQFAPTLFDRPEDAVDALVVGDVARHHRVRANRLRQGPHALSQRFSLKGEAEFGALGMGGAGDAPGDGPVIGDTHDESALAGHKAFAIRHYPSHCVVISRRNWPHPTRTFRRVKLPRGAGGIDFPRLSPMMVPAIRGGAAQGEMGHASASCHLTPGRCWPGPGL